MTSVDIAVLATVVGSVVLFGGAAVLALGWAFRSGQFDNFQQGSLSIFGPDEPVGESTDYFPDVNPERRHSERGGLSKEEANRDGH